METEQTYYCNECKHFSIHFYKGKLEHCTPCGSRDIYIIDWIKVNDVITWLKGYQEIPSLMTDKKCVYILVINFMKMIEKQK